MKLGKQHKRFGGPSRKFLERKLTEGSKVAGIPVLLNDEDDVKAEVEVSEVTNAVRLYLDDERPCPEGWTLARTPYEFFKLLEDEDLCNRVTHISLDWYLGAGQVDGVEVSRALGDKFMGAVLADEGQYMPKLKSLSFHSSDREAASRMHQKLHDAIECCGEDRLNSIRFRRHTPNF